MYPLVEQCLAGHSEAWGELWLIYDHLAAQPVRRLLKRAGFDAGEADDVAVEIFARLWEQNGKRLRSFLGTTEAELGSWLVHLAVNFIRDWIERRWRAMKREKRAIGGRVQPSRGGETEQEIIALLKELEAIAPQQDVDRFRMFAGLKPSQSSRGDSLTREGEQVSERTLRRWKKQLEEKLRTGVWSGRERKKEHTPPSDTGGEAYPPDAGGEPEK